MERRRARFGWAGAGLGLALIGTAIGGGAGRGLAQDGGGTPLASPAASPVAALAATPRTGAGADDEIAPRPAHIHLGTCEEGELGEIVEPLSDVTRPEGEAVGQAAGVTAETSFSSVPITLEALLAEDYAINVHRSEGEIDDYLACGEIGGVLEVTGALQIGLKAVGGSGFVGIAYLSPDPEAEATNVSIFLAEGLPDGSGDAGAGEGDTNEASTSTRPVATIETSTGADGSDVEGEDEGDGDAEALDGPAATPVATEGAANEAEGGDEEEARAEADNVEVVLVSLREFAIDMPTTLAPGRTTFSITNDGAIAHSFLLSGEGIEDGLEGRLQAGESATLTVDLLPGTYEVVCPVGNHADQGMVLEVVVEEE